MQAETEDDGLVKQKKHTESLEDEGEEDIVEEARRAWELGK